MSDRCEKCNKPTSYQGWPNYETWAVKLWMDNDQGEYDYWRDAAVECWNDADHDPPLYASQTRSDRARSALAARLKQYWDEDCEERSGVQLSGVYADLLNAALGEVDWYAIADSLLGDMDESGHGDDCDSYEARS